MLVLSRKVGESIVLDNGTTITLAEIRQGKCRIGIEAPANVRIMRDELVGEMQADSRDQRKRTDRTESD